MATQIDRESKRRGASADPAQERTAPLTWEEQELEAYEPKRAKAVEEKRKAAAKAALLLRQLPHQWNALREIVNIRCESLNAKAGRTILRSVGPQQDRLEIRREDDSQMEVRFDAASKKVTFSGKAFGYDREYELIVQSYGDSDTTVWYSQASLATEQPDEIAKTMLATFLRADES
jgi:hypothetical protein